MKRLLLPLTLVAALALAIPAAADEHDTSSVTVLHGVPGLEVDVYADGQPLVEGFATGESSGPTDLPAGDYEIAVRAAGEAADSEPAIAADITVPADENVTAIAHLDESGDPTLTTFVNDTSAVEAGQARLEVRHTAAFGAVDVLADGEPAIEGLTNPEASDALELPAGTYDVAVTAAGDPDTEALRTDLALAEGTAHLVHAIGDPTADTFDVIVQTVEGLHSAPDAVDTGTGGLAADADRSIPAAVTALTVALLAAAMIARPLIARRR